MERAREWVELSQALQRIKDILLKSEYMYSFKADLSALLAKRLQQCLNPELPPGLHSLAVEVYTLVFRIIEEHKTYKTDLGLFSSGLFTFFQFASFQVKPSYLKLLDKIFSRLGGEVIICLNGLIACLLPGLEDQNQDILAQIEHIFTSLHQKVGTRNFFGSIWLSLLRMPRTRIAALKFLKKTLPKNPAATSSRQVHADKFTLFLSNCKLHLNRDNNQQAIASSLTSQYDEIGSTYTASSTPWPQEDHKYAREEDLSVVSDIVPDHTLTLQAMIYYFYPNKQTLVINALIAGLQDKEKFVNRSTVDLLLSHLPFISEILSDNERTLLIRAGLDVLLKRDYTCSQNFIRWLFTAFEESQEEQVAAGEEQLNLEGELIEKPLIDALKMLFRVKEANSPTDDFEVLGLKQALTAMEILLQKKESITAAVLERIFKDVLIFIEYHMNRGYLISAQEGTDLQASHRMVASGQILAFVALVKPHRERVCLALARFVYETIRTQRYADQDKRESAIEEAIRILRFALDTLGIVDTSEASINELTPILSELLRGMPQLVQRDQNMPLFTKAGFSREMKVDSQNPNYQNQSSPHSNLLIIFPGLELIIRLLRMLEDIMRGGGRNSKLMKSGGQDGVTFIKSQSINAPAYLGEARVDRDLQNAIQAFQEFYIHLCKRLFKPIQRQLTQYEINLMLTITKGKQDEIAMRAFSLSSQILLSIEKYGAHQSKPIWLDQTLDRMKRLDQPGLALICIQTIVELIVKKESDGRAYRQLQLYLVGKDEEVQEQELLYSQKSGRNAPYVSSYGKGASQQFGGYRPMDGSNLRRLQKATSTQAPGQTDNETAVLFTKSSLCKDTISQLWGLLNQPVPWVQSRVVELLLRFDSGPLRKSVVDHIAFDLAQNELKEKVEAMQRFALFWQISSSYPSGAKIFSSGDGLFNMLDYLDDRHPMLRHSSKSWLIESLDCLERILDPLLFVLLSPKTICYVTRQRQLFFTCEYDTSRTIELFRKLRSIITTTKSAIEKLEKTEVSKDIKEALRRHEQLSRTFGFSENPKNYLEALLFVALKFTIAQAPQGISRVFFNNNESINACAADFLEQMMNTIGVERRAAQISHLLVRPILVALRNAIHNSNSVMQVQLLNILTVLVSPEFTHESQVDSAKEIVGSQLFLRNILNGLKLNQDSYTRSHYISFLYIFVPLLLRVLRPPRSSDHLSKIILQLAGIFELYELKRQHEGRILSGESPLGRSMSFRVSTGAVHKGSLDIVGNDQRQISDLLDPEEILKGELINQGGVVHSEQTSQLNENDVIMVLECLNFIWNDCLNSGSQRGGTLGNLTPIWHQKVTFGDRVRDFFSTKGRTQLVQAASQLLRENWDNLVPTLTKIIIACLKLWEPLPIFQQMLLLPGELGICSLSMQARSNIEEWFTDDEGRPRALDVVISQIADPIHRQIVDLLRPILAQREHRIVEGVLSHWIKNRQDIARGAPVMQDQQAKYFNRKGKPDQDRVPSKSGTEDTQTRGPSISGTSEYYHDPQEDQQPLYEHVSSMRPSHYIERFFQTIAAINVPLHFYVDCVNRYIDFAKLQAPKSKKKNETLKMIDASHQSALSFFVYGLLSYAVKPAIRPDQQYVSNLWVQLVKFCKQFWQSKHPRTIVWLLEVLNLAAAKFPIVRLKKQTSELYEIVQHLLNNCANVIMGSFMITYDSKYEFFGIAQPPHIYDIIQPQQEREAMVQKVKKNLQLVEQKFEESRERMQQAMQLMEFEVADTRSESISSTNESGMWSNSYREESKGQSQNQNNVNQYKGGAPKKRYLHPLSQFENYKDQFAGLVKEIQRLAITWEPLTHGQCYNLDKIFMLITLSKISFELVNNTLGDHEKIVNAVNGLLNSLFALVKDKEKKDEVKWDLATEILLGFLNERVHPGITNAFRKKVIENFTETNFFYMSRKSLRAWAQMVKVLVKEKADVFNDQLNKLGLAAGVLFGDSKESIRFQKRQALRRVAFMIYSCDQEAYIFDKKEILVEKLGQALKTMHKDQIETEILFLIRVLHVRLGADFRRQLQRPLWPTLFIELKNIISGAASHHRGEQTEQKVLLEAFKLLELMSSQENQDFCLQQWIFLLDTYGLTPIGFDTPQQPSGSISSDSSKRLFEPFSLPLLEENINARLFQEQPMEMQRDIQKFKRKILFSKKSLDEDSNLLRTFLTNQVNYISLTNLRRVVLDEEEVEIYMENEFLQEHFLKT